MNDFSIKKKLKGVQCAHFVLNFFSDKCLFKFLEKEKILRKCACVNAHFQHAPKQNLSSKIERTKTFQIIYTIISY